jgi:oligosaccharide reducing-end xylanase
LGVFALGLLAGCTSTVDSIGKDKVATPSPAVKTPRTLGALTPPATYPNVFHDLLNVGTSDVDSHVEATYQQLFHGDPDTQAIYFTKSDGDADSCDLAIADDEACIKDLYHDDVRTEGLGIGMLVSVELDHQDEFDKLWNFAKREKRINDGANAGYFRSSCDQTTTATMISCLDPFGLQMFATALIFAHDRWNTSKAGNIDYQADALGIFDVMLHKEEQNGGITSEGVTNTFDSETSLVFDVPNIASASLTRPSILMPAFYELWGQATGNPFFGSAADAARSFLQKAADENTGLMPLRAYFDGTAKPGDDTFQPEAYRVFLNMVLDQVWTQATPAAVAEFNRVLGFFLQQGFDTYGSAYQLDGMPVQGMTDHEIALVIVNGATAGFSKIKDSDRQRFVQAVWKLETPTKDYRYYQGIMELFALCVLSGKMQVL